MSADSEVFRVSKNMLENKISLSLIYKKKKKCGSQGSNQISHVLICS